MKHPLLKTLDEGKLNLYRLELGPGVHSGGFAITKSPGWLPVGMTFHPWWLEAGYDGIEVVGHSDGTTIEAGPSVGAEAAVLLGKGCGWVQFTNLAIRGGRRQAIFAGYDARGAHGPIESLTVALDRCTVEDSGTQGDTEWLCSSYQTDWVISDCRINGAGANEHCFYPRGWSRYGFAMRGTRLEGIGAEGVKISGRPSIDYYPEGGWVGNHAEEDGVHPVDPAQAYVYIGHSQFRDWHQPHSWRGGAGMTVQGGGLNVLIESSLFKARPGDHKPCLGIDDSGGEGFGPDMLAAARRPGVPPVGHVLIRDCAFQTQGITDTEWPQHVPVVRVGYNGTQSFGEEHPIVRSFTMKRSAVLGEATYMELKRCNGAGSLESINTPEVLAKAAEWGLEGPLSDLSLTDDYIHNFQS